MTQNLIRWNPLRNGVGWEGDLDYLFRDLFRSPSWGAETRFGDRAWAPAVDIEEHPDAYVVTAATPGLTRKEIAVSLKGNVLTINGERKDEGPEKKEEEHQAERYYGAFSRRFTLPATVDQNKIEATYKDGVLAIRIPKREEEKPREIEVK